MWGSAPEWVGEDYIRLEDEGNTIVVRQCAKHMFSGASAVQFIVGDYVGDRPPPGH
jgi:hypothetical protein